MNTIKKRQTQLLSSAPKKRLSNCESPYLPRNGILLTPILGQVHLIYLLEIFKNKSTVSLKEKWDIGKQWYICKQY